MGVGGGVGGVEPTFWIVFVKTPSFLGATMWVCFAAEILFGASGNEG